MNNAVLFIIHLPLSNKQKTNEERMVGKKQRPILKTNK